MFWAATRSIEAMAVSRRKGPLAVNDTVYAELSAGFADRDQLEDALLELDLRLMPMSRAALFQAGQAFRRYRSAGGSRPNVLADFFLGAQASVEGWPLLTRDERLYRSYFPGVFLGAVT